MIASMVADGRNVRNLDFNLLSPMNETDWNGIEGPQVGPEQYVRLLHKLLVQLDQLGLRTFGWSGRTRHQPPRQRLPAGTGCRSAGHGQDGPFRYPQLRRQLSGRPGEPEESAYPAWTTGSPNSRLLSGLRYGIHPTRQTGRQRLKSASLRHQSLGQGAAGLLQYDAWDGYYEHHESMGYWGLLAYDASTGTYAPRKNYFVLRQLVARLREEQSVCRHCPPMNT